MSEQPLLADMVEKEADDSLLAKIAREQGITTDDVRDLLPKTWEETHDFLRTMAHVTEEWAGIPMPLRDFDLHVEDRYPFKDIEQLNQMRTEPAEVEPGTRRAMWECGEEVGYTVVRNKWFSKRGIQGIPGWVWLYQLEDKDGNLSRVRLAFQPTLRGAAERATYWVRTAGAAEAWDFEAEVAAQVKLTTLLPAHLYRMYFLTGTFLETSKRSGLTYVFRRNRPTLVMRGDPRTGAMRVLCCLCLHPIAYYAETWAGAMVPTDDVIAHLLMMRGDEVLLWKRANQHPVDAPEAGV